MSTVMSSFAPGQMLDIAVDIGNFRMKNNEFISILVLIGWGLQLLRFVG
jgi:hypothetical protein